MNLKDIGRAKFLSDELIILNRVIKIIDERPKYAACKLVVDDASLGDYGPDEVRLNTEELGSDFTIFLYRCKENLEHQLANLGVDLTNSHKDDE